MVSVRICLEAIIFGRACLLGACFIAIYDVLRIFRRMISHGIVWISIEDAFYWLIFGVAVFILLYRENDGAIRGFIIGGIALGAILYYNLCSRWFMKWISKLIYSVKKRLKKPRN